MGRIPCCEKDNVKRGQWTPEEDNKLSSYIAKHGTRNWRLIPKNAGLQRCGKSCRLRWINYLRPDLKHEDFSESEEQVIVKLHSVVGNRWSLIAAQLPGRTDNDVKNHWNTKVKKKLSGMGIDPVTHKPFSHLMAEITTTLALPQVAHLTEAALGCFKDEMLHMLTKKHVDFQLEHSSRGSGHGTSPLPSRNLTAIYAMGNPNDEDDTVQRIKLSVSRAMQEPNTPPSNKPWAMVPMEEKSDAFAEPYNGFNTVASGLHYNNGDGSPWNQCYQCLCTGSTCTGMEQVGILHGKNRDDEETDCAKAIRKGSDVFNSNYGLWDLSADLTNPIV